MKIATFNVNGINGRLPVLLRWLAEAQPDVVCLQELKAPDERFPEDAINEAGYGAVWHGQKSWNGVAILGRDADPVETRRGLPGDPDDTHSRYIEAAVSGILIGCLYLPNGNPAPGPKFDYKLRWFERLTTHAADLLAHEVPVALIGDFNVMPTELDVYKPEDSLHLITPQRFFVHGQAARGDRHVYASRTRFVPDHILERFSPTSWPPPSKVGQGRAPQPDIRVDLKARMRGMWGKAPS